MAYIDIEQANEAIERHSAAFYEAIQGEAEPIPAHIPKDGETYYLLGRADVVLERAEATLKWVKEINGIPHDGNSKSNSSNGELPDANNAEPETFSASRIGIKDAS